MFQQACHFRIAKGKAKRTVGFTVIELMLAVAIMGVIIYALYSVFNQTQRALRRSETDVDVSQRARAIMEMIAREVEQAQATHGFWMANIGGERRATNEINIMGGLEYPPQVQRITDRPDIEPRTNYLHNIFFYNNKTNAWQGIGYRVAYFTNGVGVLQRFETNQFGFRPIYNENPSFYKNQALTNLTYHHVADGVIHLTFVPFDANGRRLGWDTTNMLDKYRIARRDTGGAMIPQRSSVTNGVNNAANSMNLTTVELIQGYPQGDENQQYVSTFNFRSNALPYYIEMELGLLEPQTLELYYTMIADKNPNATNFLARQINRVHLFRQRIPIRAAAQ